MLNGHPGGLEAAICLCCVDWRPLLTRRNAEVGSLCIAAATFTACQRETACRLGEREGE
jgi:hypothetical protein